MNLQDKLQAGRFVFTAEVTPPLSAARADLLAKALPLKGLADAVNVTDGASARPHMSALASAAIMAAEGIEPILQMTCRDRNRIALQSDLLGAAASGIRNILVLRGDNPSAGDQPDTKPVFDLDVRKLIMTAKMLRDECTLPTGRPVAGRADFFIGAADNPIDPPPGWSPDALAGKLQSGAQFVQTQFCMDAGVVERYTSLLATRGLGGAHLIVGIAPLKSAKSARWMREKLFGTIIPDVLVARMENSADAEAEGARICLELIEQFARIRGVAGVHLMAPSNDAALPPILARAKSAKLQRAVA